MNDPADNTAQLVRDWLSGDAAAGLHKVADLQRLRNTRARAHRNSVSSAQISEHPATSHFLLPGRDRSKPLCLKVFDVSHPDHAAFFRREVHMLRKLSKASKDRITPLAPRVLLADDHTGIVVMEWVQGRSMKSELMWGYVLQRDMSSLLNDCGAWLRQFHQANGIAEQPAPAIEMMDETDRSIAALQDQARPSVLHSAGLLRALDLLRNQAPGLDGMPVDWSLNHRDFTPSNLIRETSSGALMGIDFGYAVGRSPVPADLASFMLRTSDLTAGSLRPRSRINENFVYLARGYNPDASPDQLRWLQWCVLHAAVARLVRRETADALNTPSLPGRVRRAIARRFAARAVKHHYLQAETD